MNRDNIFKTIDTQDDYIWDTITPCSFLNARLRIKVSKEIVSLEVLEEMKVIQRRGRFCLLRQNHHLSRFASSPPTPARTIVHAKSSLEPMIQPWDTVKDISPLVSRSGGSTNSRVHPTNEANLHCGIITSQVTSEYLIPEVHQHFKSSLSIKTHRKYVADTHKT